MIEFYTADTPNGHKIHLMLEELGLPYNLHKFDLSKGEQKSPEFLKINPNGKIPAIVDSDSSLNLSESGAILIYLAEKTGKLLAASGSAKYKAFQWLMFQMSAVGPMLGQVFFFTNYAPEKIPYAIERYTNESKRLFGVLNEHLQSNIYLAGDEYSIADIATYPWIRASEQRLSFDLNSYPNLQRWMKGIGERDAVKKVFR
ncbi:MAG: glutathione S-transferase N-terminal domain-containing protein [Candidatus Caenarcaniphilales bacterium]|nr:glutathione S-transferase N-terminal domain-containing protein [Candidatus Caenarcaniphilales bacterium]